MTAGGPHAGRGGCRTASGWARSTCPTSANGPPSTAVPPARRWPPRWPAGSRDQCTIPPIPARSPSRRGHARWAPQRSRRRRNRRRGQAPRASRPSPASRPKPRPRASRCPATPRRPPPRDPRSRRRHSRRRLRRRTIRPGPCRSPRTATPMATRPTPLPLFRSCVHRAMTPMRPRKNSTPALSPRTARNRVRAAVPAAGCPPRICCVARDGFSPQSRWRST